ncbi:hypothetical protein EJ08DRAFT_666633 [Tothia fuscella]|uniref:Uncharacterized protein n=1 Tax=Tothia fuscella TaxID=1048955 RepID=A0A9P4TS18_9PEZI|nr:hypothetical protein EJ08DRAFT_666633 [Tothia fuscella]
MYSIEGLVTVSGPTKWSGPLTEQPRWGDFFCRTAYLPRETPVTFQTLIGFGDCPLPSKITANTTAQDLINKVDAKTKKLLADAGNPIEKLITFGSTNKRAPDL